jgi:hypothetical protein
MFVPDACSSWLLNRHASINGTIHLLDISELDADMNFSGGHGYVVCSQNEHARITLPPPLPYAARAHTTSMDVRSLEKSKVQPPEYPYRMMFKRATGVNSHL